MSSPYRDYGRVLNIARFVVRYIRILLIRVRVRGKVILGRDVAIGVGFDIRPATMFQVGNRVGIGKNFTCEVDTAIGNDVLISSNVSFVGNDHLFDDLSSTVYGQGRAPNRKVVLEGDNLIGFGTIVISGVVIGERAIVGAGSVVTKDVLPGSIVAGVPARFLRWRFPNQ